MAGNVDADIRPKVDGFLLNKLYSEGSFVQKGQPMFHLDQRQSQAAVEQAKGQLEQARAGLAQAEIDVKRYTPLVQQKAVSQAELDKATSMRRAGTAQVAAAKPYWTTQSLTSLGQLLFLPSPELQELPKLELAI